MTRDDVICMAREASGGTDWWPVYGDTLERFAALVVAAEREECAKVADYCQSALYDPMNDLDCAAAIRARSQT